MKESRTFPIAITLCSLGTSLAYVSKIYVSLKCRSCRDVGNANGGKSIRYVAKASSVIQ